MMENPRAPVVPYDKCPLGYILYDDIHQDKDDVTTTATKTTITTTTTTEKGIKKSTVTTSDDTTASSASSSFIYYNYSAAEIIKLHNKALCLLKKENKATDGVNVLLPVFYHWISIYNSNKNSSSNSTTNSNNTNDEECSSATNTPQYNIHLACHVCFLLIDCILQSYRGCYNGLPQRLPFSSTKKVHGSSNTSRSGGTSTTIGIGSSTSENMKKKKKKAKQDMSHDAIGGDNHMNEEEVEITGTISIEEIVSWMEAMINEETQHHHHQVDAAANSHSHHNNTTTDNTTTEKTQQQHDEEYINELKFRWHLYKARVLLLQREQQTSSDTKTATTSSISAYKTRFLKKELKSALELYHHKLRIVDTTTSPQTNNREQQQKNQSLKTFVTQHRNPTLQNQIALYIKANHENHWNLNPKRSLKLCMEARRLASQMLDQQVPPNIKKSNYQKKKNQQELLEDAIYYNNLGIIHVSSGKIHMAYIYYTKAVSQICSLYNQTTQSSNKTTHTVVAPLPVCEILHNGSIVALQAKQYFSAYYYMAKCIQLSPNVFAKRSRCWLRLAEAVIGYYNTNNPNPAKNKYELSYKGNKSPDFIPRLVSYTTNLVQNYDYENEPYLVLSPVLGDEKDMEQLKEIPLRRALFCLRAALRTCPSIDTDCHETIHLHMAYCHLEQNEYISSLHSSNIILDEKRNSTSTIGKRRRVTARLYACESLCYLGKVRQALQLFHDAPTTALNHKDDSSWLKPNNGIYKQHANDLSMVNSTKNTTEDIQQSNPKNERRLKDATSVIHLAASAIYAFQSKIPYTEEYALSALEKEDMATLVTESNPSVFEDVKIVALRNILYCMLKKEQWEDARILLHELLRMGVVEGDEKVDCGGDDVQEEKHS